MNDRMDMKSILGAIKITMVNLNYTLDEIEDFLCEFQDGTLKGYTEKSFIQAYEEIAPYITR